MLQAKTTYQQILIHRKRTWSQVDIFSLKATILKKHIHIYSIFDKIIVIMSEALGTQHLPLSWISNLWGCFPGIYIKTLGEMRGKGGGEAPCLSQTRKPERGGRRTLAQRPAAFSPICCWYAGSSQSQTLKTQAYARAFSTSATTWAQNSQTPSDKWMPQNLGDRVPLSSPKGFAKIWNLAKLKNHLHEWKTLLPPF